MHRDFDVKIVPGGCQPVRKRGRGGERPAVPEEGGVNKLTPAERQLSRPGEGAGQVRPQGGHRMPGPGGFTGRRRDPPGSRRPR